MARHIAHSLNSARDLCQVKIRPRRVLGRLPIFEFRTPSIATGFSAANPKSIEKTPFCPKEAEFGGIENVWTILEN
jgi:hypothetical protein